MAQFTPEEEQDIIRRYNAAFAAGIPINARLAKDVRDLEVGIKGYTDAVDQKTKEVIASLSKLAINSTDGKEGLALYSEITQKGLNATATWAEKIPLIGKVAKFFGESAATYVNSVVQSAEAQNKAAKELSQSGLVVGMTDTFNNLESSGFIMPEIAKFTELAKENATTLAAMGGTATTGFKEFISVNHELTNGALMTKFTNMGLNIEDITESEIQYIKLRQSTGSSAYTKDMTYSVEKYIEKQQLLAKITGSNSKKQATAYERALELEQFSGRQSELQDIIAEGGAGAEAAKQEFARNEEVIKIIDGISGENNKELMDGLALILAGKGVNDPRFQQSSTALRTAKRLLDDGVTDTGQIVNAIISDSARLTVDERKSAGVGTFQKQMGGAYQAFLQIGSNKGKDIKEALRTTKPLQEDQAAGKLDPNTKNMAQVTINLRQQAKLMDSFNNAGVIPVTSAFAKISGMEQQIKGVAAQLAGKKGQIGGGTTLIEKGENLVNSAADTAKNVANSVVDTITESLKSTATFGISDSRRFVNNAQKIEKENAAAKEVQNSIPLKKYDVGGYTGDPATYVASSAPPTTPSMSATELAAKIFSNKALVKEVKTEETDDTESDIVSDAVPNSTNTEGYKQYLQTLSFKSNPTNTIDVATQAKQFIEQQGALAKSPATTTDVNNSDLITDVYDSPITTNPNVTKTPSLGRMPVEFNKSSTSITALTTGLSNNLQNNPKDSATVSPTVNDTTGYTQSQQPLSTTVTNKNDNSTDMGMVSPQVKKTLGTYSQLTQSGNFENLFGNFSTTPAPVNKPPVVNKSTENSKYEQLSQSGSFEKMFGELQTTSLANSNPSVGNNVSSIDTIKNTASTYGELAKTGNFDNNFGSFKEMASTVAGVGGSVVSSTSDKFSQVFNIFPQLVNLFSKIGQSQIDFTNINDINVKEQLSNQQLMAQDAKKNLELVTKQQNNISDITNNLVTKGITPTQKSFKLLKDMLELRSESAGSRTLSSGGGTGAMGGMRTPPGKKRSANSGGSAGGGSSGGGSSGGGSSGGGSAGAETSMGSAGASAGSSGSVGSSGSAGSSSAGVAESTPSGSPPTGTAANAMKLNTGSSGSVAGGTAETEKAGGLAAGTGPTTVGQNQQLFLQAMTDLGVTDPKVRAAMAASAEGESGFKMQSEIGYENTSNENIRKSFGMGSVFGKMPDDELTKIKADPAKFFDYVYGGRFGNDQPGDGWKYRGRGFIGITFKGNYKQYGERLGIDLVGSPDLANDPKIAAKIGVMMMLDGMKKSPGADPYTQVARSIGNSNAVTEQRKKDAYARNMQTGEFGADKVADLSSLKKGGGATQTASATAPLQTAQAEIPSAQETAPAGQKMQSAQLGGILKGSPNGYQAMLHGDEAVVPLPDGKSIPVSMPEQDDGSEQLVALLSAKCQKLGKLVDQMSKHAEMSRKLLQLQS